MPSLWPCADCARYVRGTDATCPFCGATAPLRAAAPESLIERPPRVPRSALVALAAALATGGVAACSDRAVPPPPPPQLVAPVSPPRIPEPGSLKPTPTATIDVVASPPEPAPPPPVIPPRVTTRRRETQRVQQIQQDEEVVRDVDIIRVAPPYGAPPPPPEGEMLIFC